MLTSTLRSTGYADFPPGSGTTLQTPERIQEIIATSRARESVAVDIDSARAMGLVCRFGCLLESGEVILSSVLQCIDHLRSNVLSGKYKKDAERFVHHVVHALLGPHATTDEFVRQAPLVIETISAWENSLRMMSVHDINPSRAELAHFAGTLTIIGSILFFRAEFSLFDEGGVLGHVFGLRDRFHDIPERYFARKIAAEMLALADLELQPADARYLATHFNVEGSEKSLALSARHDTGRIAPSSFVRGRMEQAHFEEEMRVPLGIHARELGIVAGYATLQALDKSEGFSGQGITLVPTAPADHYAARLVITRDGIDNYRVKLTRIDGGEQEYLWTKEARLTFDARGKGPCELTDSRSARLEQYLRDFPRLDAEIFEQRCDETQAALSLVLDRAAFEAYYQDPEIIRAVIEKTAITGDSAPTTRQELIDTWQTRTRPRHATFSDKAELTYFLAQAADERGISLTTLMID